MGASEMSTATKRVFGLAGSGLRAGSITARIVRAYRAASPEMTAAGRAWYPLAGSIAADISTSTGERVDTVAAVIAALSPQTRWSTNVAAAQAICDGNRTRYPSMLGDNHLRALNVLGRDNPADGLGKGPKVHAFYENILGDPDAVTIDSWAVRAAVSPVMLSHTGVGMDSFLKRKNVYSDLANCYRAASLIVGEQPATLQAIVWCAIRGRAD
jgi:hypothetical protein